MTTVNDRSNVIPMFWFTLAPQLKNSVSHTRFDQRVVLLSKRASRTDWRSGRLHHLQQTDGQPKAFYFTCTQPTVEVTSESPAKFDSWF